MKNSSYFPSAAALCAVACFSAAAQPSANVQTSGATTQQATIVEIPTPSRFSLPQGVDIDEDGNAWFTETTAGKIAELRPNRTTTEYAVPHGGQPITVKAGFDGLWFTDGANHAIGYLDPSTGIVQEYALPSGASPLFLQLGWDGSKWFSETTGVGRLSLSGTITEWEVVLEHPDDNIEQLSIDRAGDVWFVERNFDGAGPAGTNKVRRLNPGTNLISTYLVPTLGGNPAGVQTNADGTVWVSEYFANALALLDPNTAPHSDGVVKPNASFAGSNAVNSLGLNAGRSPATRTRVPPTSHYVQPRFTPGWIEYPIPTTDTQAEDMRIDRYGRVWFEGDIGRLGVLNPYTARFTEYAVPSANSGYYNIALDQDKQRLWFTEAGAFGTVTTKIGYLSLGRE